MNQESNLTPARNIDVGALKKKVAIRLLMFILIMAFMFFVSAGTMRYWEAWVYMAILFIPLVVVLASLSKHDPELLERRTRTQEKEAEQKMIMKLSGVFFFLVFLLPGLDQRYGWSAVPTAIVIVADTVVLSAYYLFVRVLKENRYASRIIEVVPGQKVITTGPYAVVRHPMYLVASLMYVFSPLALGSYWGMIPAVLLVLLLIARILHEEKVLTKELQGYQEYARKVKYRLIPGIW